MPYWLFASLLWVLAVGSVGITIKISLQHVTWPLLLLSTTVVYVLMLSVVALRGSLHVPATFGAWWAAVVLTGVLTAGAFPLLTTALERAPASRVVPITAAYPIVTVVLGVVLLAEKLTPITVTGIAFIVFGAILVGR